MLNQVPFARRPYPCRQRLCRATSPVLEALENRLLLAATTDPLGDWGWAIATPSTVAGACVVDDAGTLYVTGSFYGTTNFAPTGSPAVNLTGVGSNDVFVAAYDASGSLLWAQRYGGAADERGMAITVSGGHVYVGGIFYGPGEAALGTSPFTNAGADGISDGFLMKIDASTHVVEWACQFGAVSHDVVEGVGVDDSGNVFVSGRFEGAMDFDPSTDEQILTPSNSDIFVASYDADGDYRWAHKFGGADWEFGGAMDVDSSGNVLVVGTFFGSAVDFDPDPVDVAALNSNNGGCFALKLTGSGDYVWAKNFAVGGTAEDVAIGPADSVYVAGRFDGTDVDFDPAPGTTALHTGVWDVYALRLEADGDYVWSAVASGPATAENANGIAVDTEGNAYITGYVSSATVTFGGLTVDGTAGKYSIFVAKAAAADGTWEWARAAGDPTYTSSNQGVDIAVDSSGGVYTVGDKRGDVDFNYRTDPAQTAILSSGSSQSFLWYFRGNNTKPTLGQTAGTFSGAVPLVSYVIDLAALTTMFQPADTDVPAQTVSFQFAGLDGGAQGTLLYQSGEPVAVGAVLGASETWYWLADVDATSGAAFTVRAHDGTDASDDIATVTINIAASTPFGSGVVATWNGAFFALTFKLSGAGDGRLFSPNGQISLIVEGANAKTKLDIAGKAPAWAVDGLVVANVRVVGSGLASLTAKGVDLRDGSLQSDGAVASVVFDDVANAFIELGNGSKLPTTITLDMVADASITTETPIKALTVTAWTDTGEADEIVAPSITALTVKGAVGVWGDFQADLHLSGCDKKTWLALGSAKISGIWSDAEVTARFGLGAIAGGQLDGIDITALFLNSMTVRSVQETQFLLNGFGRTGQSLGKLSVSGSMVNSTVHAAAHIGSVVLGKMDASSIYAGIDSGVTGMPEAGDFARTAMLGSLEVKGLTTQVGAMVINGSNIAAAHIGSLKLRNVKKDNPSAFGVTTILGVDTCSIQTVDNAGVAAESLTAKDVTDWLAEDFLIQVV